MDNKRLIIEGEKWDAVKSHLKKHKGKYLLGAAAAGGVLSADKGYLGDDVMKSTQDVKMYLASKGNSLGGKIAAQGRDMQKTDYKSVEAVGKYLEKAGRGLSRKTADSWERSLLKREGIDIDKFKK